MLRMTPAMLTAILTVIILAPRGSDCRSDVASESSTVKSGHIDPAPSTPTPPSAFERSFAPAPVYRDAAADEPVKFPASKIDPGPEPTPKVEPTAYVTPNPPALAQATKPAARPDVCQCDCQCDRCLCARTPLTGLVRPTVPTPTVPAAPQLYTMADASGKVWSSPDREWLPRWVAQCNAEIAARYSQPTYGQIFARNPPFAGSVQPTASQGYGAFLPHYPHGGYSSGPMLGGYAGGSCAGGSCR